MTDGTGVTETEWTAWRTFTSMRRQLDVALERQLQRDGDISAAEYSVLITLFEAEGKQLRARDIGMVLAWEKSRVSHQISRMEKRGLVGRRECDTDARGTWITLTADGKRAVLSAMREHSATIRSYFFDVVTADELEALRSASERVLGVITPVNCDQPE
jgi:DNA-binding MarR family transcriptional regulator